MIYCFLHLILALLGAWQPTQEAGFGDLKIDVVNIKSHQGNIIACLSTSDDAFMQSCYLDLTSKVTDADTIVLWFTSVPYGELAISIFQDQNENRKLDTNKFNIPTEPFGFSRNPRLLFGPPSFNRCSLHLKKQVQQHTIKLKKF